MIEHAGHLGDLSNRKHIRKRPVRVECDDQPIRVFPRAPSAPQARPTTAVVLPTKPRRLEATAIDVASGRAHGSAEGEEERPEGQEWLEEKQASRSEDSQTPIP